MSRTKRQKITQKGRQRAGVRKTVNSHRSLNCGGCSCILSCYVIMWTEHTCKSEFTELMKHKGRRKNMIEQIFKLTQGNEKTVEKVIIDENIHYMHMILNKGECLPEHFSNAKNVYITVVRGTLSATLNEQETHEYQAGTVLKVPFHTKMNLKNVSEETLEFIVVKAPAPNC